MEPFSKSVFDPQPCVSILSPQRSALTAYPDPGHCILRREPSSSTGSLLVSSPSPQIPCVPTSPNRLRNGLWHSRPGLPCPGPNTPRPPLMLLFVMVILSVGASITTNIVIPYSEWSQRSKYFKQTSKRYRQLLRLMYQHAADTRKLAKKAALLAAKAAPCCSRVQTYK